MTLRITTHENETAIGLKLEGRLAGPWVEELSRSWGRTAPRAHVRKLLIDLRELTYTDDAGRKVLRNIFAETSAEIIAGNPLTQYLAQQIKSKK